MVACIEVNVPDLIERKGLESEKGLECECAWVEFVGLFEDFCNFDHDLTKYEPKSDKNCSFQIFEEFFFQKILWW